MFFKNLTLFLFLTDGAEEEYQTASLPVSRLSPQLSYDPASEQEVWGVDFGIIRKVEESLTCQYTDHSS